MSFHVKKKVPIGFTQKETTTSHLLNFPTFYLQLVLPNSIRRSQAETSSFFVDYNRFLKLIYSFGTLARHGGLKK